MPQFMYIAKDLKGEKKTDIVEAIDEQVLVERLQAMDLFVLEIKQVVVNSSAISLGSHKVSKKNAHNDIKLDDLLSLAHQLATLLQAGLNLLRSLNMVIPQIQSRRLASVLIQVRDEVEQGKSFSQALAMHPKVFNQFWVSLVQVGEASGTMPSVLTKLAAYLEQEEALRSSIVSAMIYPLILMGAAVGSIIFFALVVAPQFEAIFKTMHGELPVITKMLLGTFKFIRGNFFFLAILLGSVVGAFWLWLKTTIGQATLEHFIDRVPVLGETVNMILTERFAAQMAILVDSGVPILLTLEIIEPMMENHQAASVISQAREEVRNGKLLGESIGKFGFFPDIAVQMINVGEQTGELGKMFSHIAGFFQGKVQTVVKRLSIIIEPIMLFFMAGTIGTIAVAIFLPLFKLGQGSGIH